MIGVGLISMRYLLVQLSFILFLTTTLFGQSSERPETIVIPVSSLGEVSEVRKQILQNTLEDELKSHFRLISQDRFEEVQEKVFEELEYDECTEEQCIVMIQEMLQVENVFHLQVLGEGDDTQLSLSWRTLDEKRKETDYCEGCKTKKLTQSIQVLVKKLYEVSNIDIKKKNQIWYKGILENNYAGYVIYPTSKLGRVSLIIKLYIEREKLFGSYEYNVNKNKIKGRIYEITNKNIINKNNIKLFWKENTGSGEVLLESKDNWKFAEGTTTRYRDGSVGKIFVEKISEEQSLLNLFIDKHKF